MARPTPPAPPVYQNTTYAPPPAAGAYAAGDGDQFAEFNDDDGELPF